ncbi:MAG: P1 family peptidase [Microbacterium sp.]
MSAPAPRPRARDLGIVIGDQPPGPHNAITDVPGIRVGHTTLIEGDGPRMPGVGPVRTGVTVVLPNDEPWRTPVYAAPHRLNGNGELTGLEWIRESGMLSSHIGLTNTHSVGVVRDALVAYEAARRDPDELFFALPVVGETWDGVLNDINGFHVTREHVFAAIEAATDGPVAEGSVGSGTGMICHGFKGGIGTSSRIVEVGDERFTVGVLVQANHGARERLAIDGVPVGELHRRAFGPEPNPFDAPPGTGSIIVIVATDAPLLPVQCGRLAQRAGLGVARVGGAGENGSGDIFLCFATGAGDLPAGFDRAGDRSFATIRTLSNEQIDGFFYATIAATEEAIVNAMLASDTMSGALGECEGIPVEWLVDTLARHAVPKTQR